MTTRSSVWLVAQRPSREQRRGRYLPESSCHPGKMAPALAAQAIGTYTQPGDVVADPMCGIGTTLVEAAGLGRDGFGVEYEPRWAALAEANVAVARAGGAPGEAEVVVGDCRRFASLMPAELVGQVALVLTSPPYGSSTHGQVSFDGRRVHKRDTHYSADRANLAYGGVGPLLTAMEDMLRGAFRVLTADGVVVLTARPWRRDGALIDLPGALVGAAVACGFVLAERNVALLAAVRGHDLVPRASFFQLNDVRKARLAGRPQHVIAHEDVLVFRKHP
ncbi:MAG: RNA methyltransferase [Actinobacteria bacterium]|nr:MAG: RNA methyltransferase [Actinomycetota bacterium]